MGTPYLGELRIFSFNFAPKGWATCNGQLLAINSNQALFSLLGTTFGGNGTTTFGLPNLQGRAPVHVGNGLTLGASGGTASLSLSGSQVPSHLHNANGSTSVSTSVPGSTVLPGTPSGSSEKLYVSTGSSLAAMGGNSVVAAGGGQGHENRQPSLALTICIAIQGIFPPRS